MALLLAAEFEEWFRNLGARGAIPRAFTGVSDDGRQVIVILTGLPFDHVQRRDFLIWLCRAEQFVAYAYATHVQVVDDPSDPIECIDIYGSSDRYDVSKVLGIEKLDDGSYKLHERHYSVSQPNQHDCVFLGLHRSADTLPEESDSLFRKLWEDLKPKAMWRQRIV